VKEHRESDPLLIPGGGIKGVWMYLRSTDWVSIHPIYKPRPRTEMAVVHKKDSGSSQNLVFALLRM